MRRRRAPLEERIAHEKRMAEAHLNSRAAHRELKDHLDAIAQHIWQPGDQHTVKLPHPARSGPKTTGTCVCGWTVAYGWGGHRDAAREAGRHIENAGHAQPIEAQTADGTIRVMEGLSL